MNNTILFFRDRDAVRLAIRSAAPLAATRLRVIEPTHPEAGRSALTCRWQRDQLTGRLAGRWSREHRTLSEEGVSRSLRYALAA
jgi:hypothetical protein